MTDAIMVIVVMVEQAPAIVVFLNVITAIVAMAEQILMVFVVFELVFGILAAKTFAVLRKVVGMG